MTAFSSRRSRITADVRSTGGVASDLERGSNKRSRPARRAVLDLANGDERILVTADKDFGELVFRLRQVAFGVLLVRLPGLRLTEQVQLTARR